MDDVVLQNAWVLYRINKDEGKLYPSLPAFQRNLVIATFLKYSKEGRLFSNHIAIQNVLSNICHELAQYQVAIIKQSMCKV